MTNRHVMAAVAVFRGGLASLWLRSVVLMFWCSALVGCSDGSAGPGAGESNERTDAAVGVADAATAGTAGRSCLRADLSSRVQDCDAQGDWLLSYGLESPTYGLVTVSAGEDERITEAFQGWSVDERCGLAPLQSSLDRAECRMRICARDADGASAGGAAFECTYGSLDLDLSVDGDCAVGRARLSDNYETVCTPEGQGSIAVRARRYRRGVGETCVPTGTWLAFDAEFGIPVAQLVIRSLPDGGFTARYADSPLAPECPCEAGHVEIDVRKCQLAIGLRASAAYGGPEQHICWYVGGEATMTLAGDIGEGTLLDGRVAPEASGDEGCRRPAANPASPRQVVYFRLADGNGMALF